MKNLNKRPSSWTINSAASASALKHLVVIVCMFFVTSTAFAQVVFISESEITSCGGTTVEGQIDGDIISYEWSVNDVVIAVNENSIYVSAIGTATYILTGYFVGDIIKSDSVIVNIFPVPQINISPSDSVMIFSGDSVIIEADIGDSWQWYLDDNIIPGAISQIYYATSSGNYTVRATIGPCYGISNSIMVTVIPVNIRPIIFNNDLLYVYPNPTSHGQVIIETDEVILNIQCYNLMGQLLLETQDKVLNINSLSQGTYIIKVSTEKGIVSEKLIVQ